MKQIATFCAAIVLLFSTAFAQEIPKPTLEPIPTIAPATQNDPWLDPQYVANKLSEVPPLIKPHLTWPRMYQGIWDANQPAIREHARVTKAVGYPLDYIYATAPIFHNLDDLVDEFNAMPFALMEPYNYPSDPNWTEGKRNLDFTETGFFTHIEYVKMALDVLKAESRHEPKIFLLDTEVFRGCQDNWEHDLVLAKLNLIYGMIKSEFPDAEILWFCQGCRGWKSDYYGWSRACTVPADALGDGFSSGLYSPEQRYLTRQTFRKVVEWADECGVQRVVPWLSFGYHKQYSLAEITWTLVPPFGHYGVRGAWDNTVAWELGWEINNEKPVRAETDWTPWERADFTCGWPSAYKGAGLTPGYWENLYWYARGSANMR